MNEFKLSIIIPVYNKQKYISKCIRSLTKSKCNIEIIVVDDGSIDNSGFIVKKLQKKFNNIFYFYKKNGGVSSARNFGLLQVHSEYVTFLDADDTFVSKNLPKMLGILDKNVDLLVSSYNVKKGFVTKNNISLFKSYRREDYYDNFLDIFMYCQRILCKFYKISLIRKSNLKFDESLNFAEDTLFNIEYLSVSKNVYTIPIITYSYRKFIFCYTLSSSCKNVNDSYEKIFRKSIDLLEKLKTTENGAMIENDLFNFWFYYCSINYLRKLKDIDLVEKFLYELLSYFKSSSSISFHFDKNRYFDELDVYYLNREDFQKYILYWKQKHSFKERIARRVKGAKNV